MQRVLFIFILFLCLIRPALAESVTSTCLKTANYIAIAANIATMLACLFAGWQLHQNTRQHKENARRQAAEKAIEIAKYFQSSLIPDISYITIVLRLIGQDKIFQKSQTLYNPNLRFTSEEFEELFGKTEVENYKKSHEKITLELLSSISFDLPTLFSASAENSLSEDVETKKEIAQKYFSRKRSNALNSLEWVAMLINTHVASDETIYQSLHQIFLRYIRLEYPTISQNNSDNNASDQYFTNIILLYRRWEKKWELAHKKDQKLKEKHQRNRDSNVNYPPPI